MTLSRLLLLLLFLSVVACASAAETAPAPTDGLGVLDGIRSSYYDLDQAGLRRAACYVKCDDVLQTMDTGARRVLRRVKYEAIVVPGKPIEVKVRDMPGSFPVEARAGAEMYRIGVEKALRDIFTGIDQATRWMDPQILRNAYDVDYSAEEGKIALEPKGSRQRAQRPAGRWGQRSSRPTSGDIVLVELDKERQLKKIELLQQNGREETLIETKVRDGRWAFRKIDLAKYDSEDRLRERSIIELDYAVEKGLLLPKKMTITAVDAKGKAIERRGEANPLRVEFTDWDVEVRE